MDLLEGGAYIRDNCTLAKLMALVEGVIKFQLFWFPSLILMTTGYAINNTLAGKSYNS